jgi:hypothetical protein
VSSLYDHLNEVVADELFGSDYAGRPVYTLADSTALQRIATKAGLAGVSWIS